MVKPERFLLSKYCLASNKLQSPSSVAHFLIPRYLYFFTFCHFPFVFLHLQTSTNPTRSTTPYSEAVQKKKKNSPYQPPPWQGGGVFGLASHKCNSLGKSTPYSSKMLSALPIIVKKKKKGKKNFWSTKGSTIIE